MTRRVPDGERGRLVTGPRFFTEAGDRPDGLELFFDLVFVLCIAQLALVLRDDPTWARAAQVVLLLVPVWWTWVGVTFCTDRYPTDDLVARLLMLLATAAVGVMALAIPHVPGRGGVAFAVGYAVVRLVLVAQYARVARSVPERTVADRAVADRAVSDRTGQVRWYATAFAATAALWVGSLAVAPPLRYGVWALAMAVDIGVPAVTDRRRGLLPVDVEHLPERFSAFVIIVLGESVVSTAELAGDALTARSAAVLAEGFLVTAGLWWGFFDRGAWRRRYQLLAGDRSGRLANIVCAYLHFPLVAGISLAAVGTELAVERADRPVGDAAALALVGGCLLYLLTLNAMTAVLGVPRTESLARTRLLIGAALVVLVGAGRALGTTAFVGLCAATLAVHVAANLRRAHRHPLPARDPA